MNQAQTDWINALRSGEYAQTRKALRDDKGYCCLGVLCDLTGGEWTRILRRATYNNEIYDAALESVGLSDDEGISGVNIIVGGENSCLIDLNDNARLTFNEIADLLEKHFKGVE
jgi:hypothetical protein